MLTVELPAVNNLFSWHSLSVLGTSIERNVSLSVVLSILIFFLVVFRFSLHGLKYPVQAESSYLLIQKALVDFITWPAHFVMMAFERNEDTSVLKCYRLRY